jgi:glycosyltransferase involved in cell wall biosynthesis
MHLAYIHPDDGGCTHYRVDLPLDTLGLKEVAKVTRLTATNSPDEITKALEPVDALIFPRPADEKMVLNIGKLKEMGKKAVVDFDDDMWNVSPLSPHYKEFGTKNAHYCWPDGNMIPLWEHGKTLDLWENKHRLDWIKETVALADLVTVPTEIIAKIYRQWNEKVVVLPNCVDCNVWKKLPFIRRNDSVRLYWSGGSSHFEDMTLLTDVFPVIMKKYPQVTLVIMGHLFKGTVKTLPQDRIEFHHWVPTSAYPYKSASLDIDISLIPLQDTVFNRCKSAIKFIEQSALSVPSVVSLVSPYQELIEGDNGVFVENSTDAWIEGISTLIEDPLLRIKIGDNARRYVEQHYDINTQYPRWVTAYQGLVNRRRPSFALKSTSTQPKELVNVKSQHV